MSECPYCGNNKEYYTKDFVSGRVNYEYRFDGEEADNTGVYDSLRHTSGKYAYCSDCEKRLFRILD